MADLKTTIERSIEPLLNAHYSDVRRQMDERLPIYQRAKEAAAALQRARAASTGTGGADAIKREIMENVERLGQSAQVREQIERVLRQSANQAEEDCNAARDARNALPLIPVDLVLASYDDNHELWTPFRRGDVFTAEDQMTYIDTAFWRARECAKKVDPYTSIRYDNEFARLTLHGNGSLADRLSDAFDATDAQIVDRIKLDFRVLSIGDLFGGSRLRETPERPEVIQTATLQHVATEGETTAFVMTYDVTTKRSYEHDLLQIPSKLRTQFPPWKVPFVLETSMADGTPVTFEEASVVGKSGPQEDVSTPEARKTVGTYIYLKAATHPRGIGMGKVYETRNWTATDKRTVRVELVSEGNPEQGLKARYRLSFPQ